MLLELSLAGPFREQTISTNSNKQPMSIRKHAMYDLYNTNVLVVTLHCLIDFQRCSTISQTCQPSRFFAGQSRFFTRCVPLNHGNVPLFVRSRIFCFVARTQFVTLPRCPDVNANHPIERNYGNSVRFFAKIPNGTAAESPCYCVFWNAIDCCRLYTSKKKSQCGPCQPSRFLPASPAFFYAKCPYKNILQVGRSDTDTPSNSGQGTVLSR